LLCLYNTLTRKVEPFKPIEDLKVKMYTCGPSTYQRPHIGNYRTFLFEDLLQRYLEYSSYSVTRLITLTDVEDKAIAQAKKENVSVEELTRRNESVFFKDFEALKMKIPDYKARASTVMDQTAALVKALVEKGYAYWHMHDGAKNTYFDPLQFEGFGKLAKLDMSKWPKKKRRFHKDTYPGTPWNRGDFIIWHGCREGEVCWETGIGRGRPAWNIQDVAMVTEHLGFQIDVACGGIDNLVRHHDYTLAIAEGVSGKKFSSYWLHGAHLLVDGKKMSKSLGNVYYPSDLMAKGYRNDQIRFYLIYRHYRKKLDFTFKKLAETTQILDTFKSMVQNLRKAKSVNSSEKTKRLADSIIPSFNENMNNDLDVKTAFDKLYKIVSMFNGLIREERLSAEDADAAITNLRRVDSVMKVIF
jgi:cysteinyl-tRNA synthetase